MVYGQNVFSFGAENFGIGTPLKNTCFRIEKSGNTRIYGNLEVDGTVTYTRSGGGVSTLDVGASGIEEVPPDSVAPGTSYCYAVEMNGKSRALLSSGTIIVVQDQYDSGKPITFKLAKPFVPPQQQMKTDTFN